MSSAAEAQLYHCRAESASDIIQLVQRTLLRADCIGVLPTPIDQLYNQLRIQTIDLPPVDDLPNLRLGHVSKDFLKLALQKIRGIADLRRRAVYLPTGKEGPRRNFTKGHELGHQLIPWHSIGRDCVDTDKTLSPSVKDTFEREANFFSSEIIFQGESFRKMARDYAATFENVFVLADLHGASNQATLWKFTEEYDFPIASLIYYRNGWTGEFRLWKSIASQSFRTKYAGLIFPEKIASDHPWEEAVSKMDLCEGELPIPLATGKLVRLAWCSWWNTHALSIMLKKRSRLGFLN